MKTIKLNNTPTEEQINKMIDHLNEYCKINNYELTHLSTFYKGQYIHIMRKLDNEKMFKFDTQKQLHSHLMTFFTKKGAK